MNKYFLKLLKPSFYDAIDKATKIESNPEIKIIQQIKLNNLINHAYNNVPYYQLMLKDYFTDHNEFRKIPILTKDAINSNFDKLIATNLPISRFKKNSTSGSTGLAMKFYSDNKTDIYRHACAYRSNSWTGWRFGEPTVILWGAPSDVSRFSGIKSKIVNSSIFLNTTIFSSFDMKEIDMEKYIQRINEIKPTLIVGYPSSLSILSDFIKRNRLKVWKPKGIVTGGETLLNFQKNNIEQTFGVRVFNRYGCRDVGHIASECEQHNGLHISSDHVLVEVLDEKGNPCKPGELGEIIVTDLDNFVFPFIRYKIGDVGSIDQRICSCGRTLPLLKSVEGRSFDIIVGTNGNKVSGNFFTLLRYEIQGITKFQVIQETKKKISISIVTDEKFDDNNKHKIIHLIKNKIGDDMEIKIKIVDNIPTTVSGKHRWIISKIK